MSSKRVRVGFVGCGRHGGERIYPSLELAGIDLVATCDLDRERAERYARRFGAESVYTDYRAMCDAEDLEAVLVVTGPQGHFEVGRELVAMGYPVWMEKPPAPTAGQAEELAAAAAEAGVHVQVGFNYRYSAGVRRARSLIDGGQFAPPRMVSVRWWLGGAEDGDEFLWVKAVYDGQPENIDTRASITIVRHLQSKLAEASVEAFPVISYIAKHDLREKELEAL